MARMTNFEAAQGVADLAKRKGHAEALDLALRAQWDFDYAMCADGRGERSRAWAKRSSGKRLLNKARGLLGVEATKLPKATSPLGPS